MLVLDGPQEIGNPTSPGGCAPTSFDDYHRGRINPDDKDTDPLVQQVDMGTERTRRHHAPRRPRGPKDFISRQEVVIRRPYGRHDIVKPALSSLIGTINEEGPDSQRPPVPAGSASSPSPASTTPTPPNWTSTNFCRGDGGLPRRRKLAADRRRTRHAQRHQRRVRGRHPARGPARKHYNIDPAGTSWISGIDIIQELEFYGLKDNQRASLMELARVR